RTEAAAPRRSRRMSKRRVNIGMRLFGHRHSLGRIAHRHLEVQPIRIERQIPIVDGGTLSVERALEHEATRQDGIPKLIEFGKLLNLQKVGGAAALLQSHNASERAILSVRPHTGSVMLVIVGAIARYLPDGKGRRIEQ